MKLKMNDDILCETDGDFFSTKSKAESFAALKIIEQLHEKGYLNDHLGVEIRQYSQKKVEQKKRDELVEGFRIHKEEKKRKHGTEEVMVELKVDYQLKHSTLHDFEGGIAYIVVFEPNENNVFPFAKECIQEVFKEKHVKSIGFLTDEFLLPKSKNMDLLVRNDQIDRINHFLKNIQNKPFYSSECEEEKVKEKTAEKVFTDTKISYEIKVIKQELNKTLLEKIKFFHVFMFNMLYSSESSFLVGLLNGCWVFDALFGKALKKVKEELVTKRIFNNLEYYEGRRYMDDKLFMFSVPIKDDKIDLEIIESCISYVKLRLLNIAQTTKLFDSRSYES